MSDRPSRESLLLPILIPIGALLVIVAVLYGFSRVLLSVKPTAATATALVAAAGTMAVAAFVASRKQVTGAALGAFLGAAAGIAMLAGGAAIAVIGPAEPEAEHVQLALVAPKGAVQKGFETSAGDPATALTVESGVPIDLEFDNEDPATGHNVQIFDGPDDTATSLVDGPVITGPDKTTYPVPALPDGEYFFHCKIHPTTMTGTITAAEGAGGIKVVAQNTAFDVKEIDLPADTPSKLTVENKDPFAHDLSIYQDESASGTPLFTFEPFPGPATKSFPVPAIKEGEYYFHCDIHPTMNGTVVVGGPPPPQGEGEGSPSPPGEGSPSPPGG
jgi:plastocyanin